MMNQTIGQLLADAAGQEGKWRAVRRVLEGIVPIYDQFSEEDKTLINNATNLGDHRAIRELLRKSRELEELSTHSIRDRARILKIKNWSRAPRFQLIKLIKQEEANRSG